MGDLLTSVVPLALAAAITPTLFALQVLVVSGPSWRSRSLAVIAGTGAVFAVVFALFLGGLSQLPDANTGRSSTWEYAIEFVCGAVLVPIAVWMLRPHPHADAALAKKVQRYADHASAWIFAGIAAYMSVSDFSSLVVLLPALHDVTRADVDLGEKAAVVAFVYVCVLLPVLVPPLAVRVAGQRGVAAMRRAYDLVMGHQVQVMGVVAAVVAAFLLWHGARGLW